MSETLLNVSIPHTVDLCCLVAKIDLTETRDSSAKSHFHWMTMKCRLIIHTMQDTVIACPVYETISSIHVITSVKFFHSEILQNNLREMNMMWSTPRPVTPDVYANCLRYSIQFAVAPLWNRVGSYMISEKYFLTFTESNCATRFNLMIQARYEKNIEASLIVQPVKVKMCNLALEDLHIPREVIAHFMADPRGVIDVASYVPYRITVLPSLKRGKLMAVLKTIPATCPFKNYGELRRHWKNMYGYRLPESDRDIIYCDIYFAFPKAARFLYPDICVRSQVSEIRYRGDHEKVVGKFLQDVKESMPAVCGQPLRITIKKEMSNSLIDENETGISFQSPKTPENSSCRENCGDRTTRFSFSCHTPKNEIRRDSSSLMSPTPSLRGNARDDNSRNHKFRNILSTIGRIHEIKPILRLSQVKNNPLETQSQCPNGGNRENDDFHGNLDNLQKLKSRNIQVKKSPPMETEFQETSICMPGSSSTGSVINVENKTIFMPIVNLSQESSSSSTGAEKRSNALITSDEIISKYFKPSKTSKGTNEKTGTQTSEKMTLSQKLLRNRNPMRKMTDGNLTEIGRFDSHENCLNYPGPRNSI